MKKEDVTFFLDIADQFKNKSKCVSYQVAAIAVKDGRIIFSGINGTAPGSTNCREVFPTYDKNEHREIHHKWSLIHEIHAEQNLIAGAAKAGIKLEGVDVFLTVQPCTDCMKLLIAAGIKRIYYRGSYDKADPDSIKYADECRVVVIKEDDL